MNQLLTSSFTANNHDDTYSRTDIYVHFTTPGDIMKLVTEWHIMEWNNIIEELCI